MKVLQPAYRRGNSYQSVYARLASPDSFQQLKDSLTTESAAARSSAMRAPDYYAQPDADAADDHPDDRRHHRDPDGRRRGVRRGQSRCTRAVASRTREIATLRALGFGSVPVVVSVLVEAVAARASSAALIGGAIAWLAFDGYETATMNFQSFSQIAFPFAVTPRCCDGAGLRAASWGWSAASCRRFRAARLPVVTALRELCKGGPGRQDLTLCRRRSESRQPPNADTTPSRLNGFRRRPAPDPVYNTTEVSPVTPIAP